MLGLDILAAAAAAAPPFDADTATRAYLDTLSGAAGKTFTAITSIYRLLKFAKAKRILFLVDTKNLGEQAEQEFRLYKPQDDNRLFTELYGVTRLSSSFIPGDSQVYISTIQRLYSILKGSELDERDEEESPESKGWRFDSAFTLISVINGSKLKKESRGELSTSLSFQAYAEH